jgi:glycerol-3-phosphate acyltransferase PlsY
VNSSIWWGQLPTGLGLLVVGYLLGSIPFGLIFTRLAGLGDVRQIGSRSIGATNVLRTGRKDLAAATLAFDALKGTAAVLIGGAFGPLPALLCGLGAFLGHLFPVWLHFKGGKGVATYLGIVLGLYWPTALFFAAVWLVVAFIARYSSLASLIATLATPPALYFSDQIRAAELMALLVVLLWLKHLPNIRRLFAGTESRIGQRQ